MMIIQRIQETILFDCSTNMYPSLMFGITRKRKFEDPTSTYFGFIGDGEFTLSRKGHPDCGLSKGMYFSATGPFILEGRGSAIAIERKGYRGLFQVGGPVEERGRLTYIDNSCATLLIPPARQGEACLNLLTFPPHIFQTEHTHPTLRMGMVFSGTGACHSRGKKVADLKPGQVFLIEDTFPHCFQSMKSPLTVIAFHPDTDWGPTDQNHPMLNRTYIR